MILFIIGMLIGGIIGFATMCLCIVAKENDKDD